MSKSHSKNTHVISALKRKRAVITGEMLYFDKLKMDLTYEVRAVDICLKLFGFNGDPTRIAPRRVVNRYFEKNELTRMIRTIMREQGIMIKYEDLAAEIIKLKGWKITDEELSTRVAAQIRGTAIKVRRRLANNL